MEGPLNLLEIELLIKAHVLANYKPDSSHAHDAAVNRLLKLDMIQLRQSDLTVTTSLRGQYWVEHLRTIPFPVESYRIPEAS
ncbi:hypothetical protein SB861_37525 [Paraburkholderia sp. SIMBA_049]